MDRTLRPALLVALALALATALAAAPAPAAGLRVLVPPDGATFARTPATLIGAGAAGALDVTLNGKKVAVQQSGAAFTGQLALAGGKNVLLVRSGAESRQVTFEYVAKGAKGRAYNYHDPVAGGECKACHPQGVGRTSPVSESRLCQSCHDPVTGGKRLHGPLGAGQCSICHDPHGSPYPKFLVLNVRALCVQCHTQSGSQSHIDKSSNKQCPECHNPHSSEKQYLLH